MLTMHRGDLAAPVRAVIEKRLPPTARNVQVALRELCGGLVSECVIHVSTGFVCENGRQRTTRFILKRLEGETVREARIYARLLSRTAWRLAPALYHVEPAPDGALHLCLEAVRSVAPWPWSNWRLAQAVLERVGSLHAMAFEEFAHELGGWDYDQELEHRALRTLELVEARARGGDTTLRRGLPATRRLQRRLPSIRAALAEFAPLPPSIIHGDLHPGNVLVRRTNRGAEPVLIDWARSRIGSPLEDVASWLQWLGFWEPQVRRKHDTLLGAYLAARGLPHTPSRAMRHAYWLAAARNCYAGVLEYHLLVASETNPAEDQHWRALRAVQDCMRVIRRADAYLRE